MTENKLSKTFYDNSSLRALFISNFADIGKTKFIEFLEQDNTLSPFSFLPNRFSKSLVAYMLSYYCDCYLAKALKEFYRLYVYDLLDFKELSEKFTHNN